MGINGSIMVAGDVEVDSIKVESDAGEFELVGLDFTINLFEDIFSNTISGYVQIIDAAGVWNDMKLAGKEKITIKWRTPEPIANDFAEFTGRIIKITDREKLKESVVQYNLLFATDEFVKDSVSQFSKVYAF